MKTPEPPLPPPVELRMDFNKAKDGVIAYGYTAGHMHEYRRAVERIAYEKAASECLKHIRKDKHGYPTANTSILEEMAVAIQGLKK